MAAFAPTDDDNVPTPAVAAINHLTRVIKRSTAATMMGLQEELRDASASLQSTAPSSSTTALSRARKGQLQR